MSSKIYPSRSSAQHINRAAFILLLLVLSACSSSDTDLQPPLDDDLTAPSAPGDLHSAVYSSTESELFWKPSVDDGWVMGYDIYRNDELIVERLDANSYFDPELEPSTKYEYAVIAVDDDDKQSAAANISLITKAGPPLPIINRANHVALLAQVFELIVGDTYNKPLLALEAVALDDSNGQSELLDQRWIKGYNCNNGGAGNSQRRDGYPGDADFSMQFTDCLLGGSTYDGIMTGTGRSIESTNFTISRTGGQSLSFSGAAIRKQGSREPWAGPPAWSATDINLRSITAEGTLTLQNATTRFEAGHHHQYTNNFRASMQGEFTLQSPATDNHPIQISTPTVFQYNVFNAPYAMLVSQADWQFEEGVMVLSATDGSTLTLDAGNDDDNSVSISLTGNGTSVQFTKPWSLWTSYLQFADEPEPVAFDTDVPADPPVIRSDNYQPILDLAFDVMTGTRHWDVMLAIPNRWGGNASFVVNREQSWAYSKSDCVNFGTAKTQYTIYGWFQEYSFSEFNNCLLDQESGITYSGEVLGFSNLGGHGYTSTGITLSDQQGLQLSFDGWIRRSSSLTKRDGFRLRHTESLNLQFDDGDSGPVSISDATFYLGRGWLPQGFRAHLGGRGIVQSPVTGDRRIELSTPIEFDLEIPLAELSDSWNFNDGQLKLLADDGSSMTVDAYAAEQDNVLITIVNAVGTSSFTEAWSNWQHYLERN